MNGIYCFYPVVFLVPVLMIALGLVYIFRKDWAWRIAESMMKYVKPQRTPQWERAATINGVIMLVFGLVSLLFIFSRLLGGT